MSVEVLHAERQAINSVRRALCLGTCAAAECRFEVLRATVWSMATAGGKVHINRVLNASIPTWRLLSERPSASEESLRAELRGALSMLEDAGDLLELGGGYWAPATARFVEFPDGAGYLLVGGVASALLGIAGDEIQFHGPHRQLAKLPSELLPLLPVEDLKAWARLPAASLQDWAREVIDALDLQPYSPTHADAFEFYIPANSKPGSSQFFRWFESAGDMSGTLLARRRRLYGARDYRLVGVRSGRIVRTCDLCGVDVRRLMYALDLMAKNPVRAQPLGAGTRTEWLLTSELPRGEQRALAAFGILKIPDERRFERRWTFVRNEELALELLRSLGIALGQQPREERR